MSGSSVRYASGGSAKNGEVNTVHQRPSANEGSPVATASYQGFVCAGDHSPPVTAPMTRNTTVKATMNGIRLRVVNSLRARPGFCSCSWPDGVWAVMPHSLEGDGTARVSRAGQGQSARRGTIAHPLTHHRRDSVLTHRDAVERVSDLHRALLVGDDQQL